MIIRFGYLNNLVGTTLASCFLSLSLGNLLSWSSPVIPKLENVTSDNPFGKVITSSQESWLSSLVTLGAVIGCWIFGAVSEVIGRKIVYISLGVFISLGYVLMAAIHKLEVYYAARFLQGVALGGAFNLMLTYLGEITSKENRGVVMTASAMMSSAGAIFCYAIGPYVSVTTFNTIELTFPIAFLVTSLIFCEESPYFFLLKNKEELAKKVLKIYRCSNYDLENDIKEMKEQIRIQKEGNVMDIFKTKGYIKALITGIGLMIGQQFTGINAILMYSQSIFALTGSSLSPEIGSLIIAVIQLFSGGLTPFISQKFDRKSILLSSGLGMIISEVSLGIYCIFKDAGKTSDSINFIPILALTIFTMSYNFGFGPLCWLVPGEIMPARVKIFTISALISIYFGIGFLIAQFFNSAVDAVGIGSIFLFFAGCCFVSCLFIKFFVIETRGKSLEEIQDILNGKTSSIGSNDGIK
ncbi:unnamed protein product [Psylliodes chrysocephalus]|uniref:Major facilitator superfamily (MFS) profile domain-containing protein n=1 Tax=Psylliodes chrysocephalus TaxID=3402493 RepID=A0A9P0G8H6_9CUCU|nr:unnamed protein product [Psylliodes chrysocephala]